MKKEESDNIQPNTERGIKHMMQSLWNTIWWDIIMDTSPMAILRKVIVIFVIEIVVLSGLTGGTYAKNRKQKEQAIEEWQDEGGNVYLNGTLQKSELDPDGLDLDNFKVEYRNGKLYIQNK